MVHKFSTKYQTMKHCTPNRTAVKKNAPKFLSDCTKRNNWQQTRTLWDYKRRGWRLWKV